MGRAEALPPPPLVYPDGLPRTFVRLDELPGFVATGLVVRVSGPDPQVAQGEPPPKRWTPDIWWDAIVLPDGRRYAYGIGLPVEGVAYLDFSDAATRDRAVRWLGSRTLGEDKPSTTAPRWGVISNDRFSAVTLVCLRRGRRTFCSKNLYVLEGIDTEVIPALADVDLYSLDELPDGSFLADALALVVVCRHVGAR